MHDYTFSYKLMVKIDFITPFKYVAGKSAYET